MLLVYSNKKGDNMPKDVLGVKLFSTKEVSEMLGITQTTTIKYINQGKIKARMIGGKRYVTEESLKEYVLGSD